MSAQKRYLYLIFTVAHILFVAGLVFSPISWTNFLMFIVGYSLLGGVGAAIGLHRWLSHKAIVLHKWAEPVVLWLSIVCIQGQPIPERLCGPKGHCEALHQCALDRNDRDVVRIYRSHLPAI
jgi:fatty-acid desaturase